MANPDKKKAKIPTYGDVAVYDPASNVKKVEPESQGTAIGVKTTVQGSEQSNQHTGFSQTGTNTSSSGSSTTTTKNDIDKDLISAIGKGEYDVAFKETPQLNADANSDPVLIQIGKREQARRDALKKPLEDSFKREKRNLRFNAWANFLTSLGNIAGWGNATPIEADKTRTINAFNRMQDIRDAAANIENDPTLTWLDRERLNRIGAIEEHNLAAETADAQRTNQMRANLASRAVNTTTTTNSESSGSSESGQINYGKSYGQNYGVSNTYEKVFTDDDGNIIGAAGGKLKPNEIAIYLGSGVGVDRDKYKALNKAEALDIVSDLLDAKNNGGKSSMLKGKDVSAIVDKIGKDLGNLRAMINGTPEQQQMAVNILGGAINSADREGLYFQHYGGVIPDPSRGNEEETETVQNWDVDSVSKLTKEQVQQLDNDTLLKIQSAIGNDGSWDDFYERLSEKQKDFLIEQYLTK